ncbi:MAG TPA: glycosyltransferase family 87 protein [Mucilaginibacter sp.]|nr:glycosyltransferase family 87 protein [Mucilaginibacter sp.]
MKRKFPWLTGYQWLWILYLLIAVACWGLKVLGHNQNNFLIFRGSFYHLIHQLNLYAAYPAEHNDYYYYGPLFGLFFAPFALPPKIIGLLLWETANAAAFLYVIHLLPFSIRRKKLLLLFCAIEFANSVFSEQFNPMIAAFIILSFLLVEKKQDVWATFLIVLGALMKLYPIAGLAFFMFSKNKPRFILFTLIWGVVLLALPALFCGPDFLIESYRHWLPAVAHKNSLNHDLLARSQDICIMGVVRDFTQDPNIPDLPFLIFGAIVFAIPLFRFKQYRSFKFRLQIMITTLIMVVIFSTGGESPTYIIPVTGVFLWILIQERPFKPWIIVLIVTLLVITGLGMSDVMPPGVRHNLIGKYGMKGWPCIIAWFVISYELLFKDFTTEEAIQEEQQVITASV